VLVECKITCMLMLSPPRGLRGERVEEE